jgi:hypothetical protein
MRRRNALLCGAGFVLVILAATIVSADKVEVKKAVNAGSTNRPQDGGSGAAADKPNAPSKPPGKGPTTKPPLALKDEATGILVYVESDCSASF